MSKNGSTVVCVKLSAADMDRFMVGGLDAELLTTFVAAASKVILPLPTIGNACDTTTVSESVGGTTIPAEYGEQTRL